MSSRSTRADFTLAGLRLLRESGPDAVTLDAVCTALGKTKGSFYHHFDDSSAFNAAILERWEQDFTDAPIATASREPDASAQAQRLDDVVHGLDHRLDRAVRAWGLRDERVARAVARVDERRIAYLEELHRGAKRKQPRVLAELEYAAFVGAQHVQAFDDPERAKKLARALRKALELVGG